LLFVGCGDNRRTLGLVEDGNADAALNKEEERIRQMQLIRVLRYDSSSDQTPEMVERSAFQIEGDVAAHCADPDLDGNQYCDTLSACNRRICLLREDLCEAKTFLAAAVPQAQPLRIHESGGTGIIELVQQSSATNAALAWYAKDRARSELIGVDQELRATLAIGTSFQGCTPADAALDDYNGANAVPRAVALAALFAEGVQTFKEATEVEIRAIVDSSDAELASTNSFALATGRAMAGGLSRAAAAHALIAGDPGLLGSTAKGFCESRELGPDAKAALQVLREAAVNPATVLSTVETEQLLNGTNVTGGSVAARLGELFGYSFGGGKTVQDHYDLDLDSFEQARRYMSEEIRAFSRSLTAELPSRRLPGGGSTTFIRYAATAAAPQPLPDVFYSALARFDTTPYNPIGGLVPSAPPGAQDTGLAYDHFSDWAFTEAYTLARVASGISDSDVRGRTAGVLTLLQEPREVVGRVRVLKGSGTQGTIEVHGFSSTRHLLLAIGADELRCAVFGHIEGSACSISSSRRFTQSTTSEYPFVPQGSVKLTANVYPSDPEVQRAVYVLEPTVTNATPGPGQYRGLVGFMLGDDDVTVPIVPEVERRAAAMLEPSRDWCARPKVSCAGIDFDERIPLENELSSDGDAIESSWRQYLTRAKEAAAEADALGVDYITSGLQDSQRKEEIELRREEQRLRADAEIQRLQEICGTSIDPRKLLSLFAGSDGSAQVQSGTCEQTSDCTESGMECVGGQCMLRIEKLVELHGEDPDIRRIGDCLSAGGITPFVSLGSRPVCLWHQANNERLVCQGASPGTCPRFAPDQASYAAYTDANCETLFGTSRPAGTTARASTPLGYFETELAPLNAPDPTGSAVHPRCEALRQARISSPIFSEKKAQIIADNFFNPANLDYWGHHLNWEARYNGYSAITVLGVPSAWATGDGWTGNSATWPCGAESGFSCTSGQGLFCNPGAACTDSAKRMGLNYRMLRAVIGARLLAAREPETFAQYDSSGNPLGALDLLGTTVRGTRISVVPIRSSGTPDVDGSCALQDFIYQGTTTPIPRLTCKGYMAYHTTGLASPVSDAWYTFNSSGTQAPVEAIFGGATFQIIPHATPTGGLIGPLKSEPVVEYDLEGQKYMLCGMSDYCANTPGLVEQLLNGDKNRSQKLFLAANQLAELSWNGCYRVSGTCPSANFPHYDQLAGDIAITGDDLLDGLELLCAVGTGRSSVQQPAAVSLNNPPVVNSIDDLEKVAAYVELVASNVLNNASLSVFSDVPTRALDGLRTGSSTGAFAQFGGEMALALSSLRTALIDVRESGPVLNNELKMFAADVRTLKNQVASSEVQKDLAGLQFASTVANQLTACANGISGAVTTAGLGSGGAAATCANSIAQINFAAGIAELSKLDADLGAELAMSDFNAAFERHATAIELQSLRLAKAQEAIDASLAQVESIRMKAKGAIARALYLSSWQAEHEAGVTNVIGNLFAGKQLRYQRALRNAKLQAFLAKRAIEQRLGIRLASVGQDYPLVEAPATWESTVCTFNGLTYDALKEQTDEGPESFAGGFIGDYVKRLENFVESYRLEHGFHEGSDTAIISLRDDVMNVRKNCTQFVRNQLYNSEDLNALAPFGWERESCPTTTAAGGLESTVAKCVDVLGIGAVGLDASYAQT
jgi:hypothetical protein